MIHPIISFGSKTIIETLQDEKSALLKDGKRYGYLASIEDLDTYIKNISKNSELAETKIVKKIAEGSSAIVYETESGDVLKLTKTRHYPLFREQEDFDVPIKKQGKSGKIYYYIEEKLYQHNLNVSFVKIIKDKIAGKGYKAYDLGGFGIHQIGMSKDGKLYLLDPECARYKSIFHALWSKFKRAYRTNILC